MLKTRAPFMAVAVVAVMAILASGCAISERSVEPIPDGSPGALAVCPEDAPDCGDLVTGGDLPPVPPDLAGAPSPGPSPFIVDGGIDISEALAYAGTEVVAVQGFYVHDGETARLCEALAESFPPQCGGPYVVVTNPEVLVDTVLEEEGSVQWSNESIALLSHVVDGELTIAADVNG